MMTSMDDAAAPPKPEVPSLGLKEFQRFGEFGPAYQVLGLGEKAETVRVRVLKSGEEFDYRLADARSDPPA
jgi:hypothetical protein